MPRAKVPSNQEKEQIWKAYRAGKPIRVPVTISTNPRIILLAPELNPKGLTFAQTQTDPAAHVEACLQWQHYLHTAVNRHADSPCGPPETWPINLTLQNVHEAAYFGAPVQYRPGQVPATEPFLTEENKHSIFKVDIERPLENPFLKRYLAFWQEMDRICQDKRFHGRPVKLAPWALCGSDGPVTVGCNLRGGEFLLELAADPDYADKLMRFIAQAAINRARAFHRYWGDRIAHHIGLADDSIALLSTPMYRQQVMPVHRLYYDAAPPTQVRGIHLCGDATRHFATIHRELGVMAFDTGFPVDHGRLRRELGPEVEILGGVEVPLLLSGTPNQVYERAKEILQSGVKAGGRFILREANNLPPGVPLANLEAMYAACLDYGWY